MFRNNDLKIELKLKERSNNSVNEMIANVYSSNWQQNLLDQRKAKLEQLMNEKFSRTPKAEMRNLPVYKNVSLANEKKEVVATDCLVSGNGSVWDILRCQQIQLKCKLNKENKKYGFNQGYCPQLNGEKWDRNGNAAYFFAAIEKGHSFIILNSIDKILERAAERLLNDPESAKPADIGGAFVELIYLMANNYSFKVNNDGYVVATPAQKIEPNFQANLPRISQKVFYLDVVNPEGTKGKNENKDEQDLTKGAIQYMKDLMFIWQGFSEQERLLVKKTWAKSIVQNADLVKSTLNSNDEVVVSLLKSLGMKPSDYSDYEKDLIKAKEILQVPVQVENVNTNSFKM